MSYFGGKQAMERMSSFERRISTQYTKSSHSVAAANQIDSCPRGVGHLYFQRSPKVQRSISPPRPTRGAELAHDRRHERQSVVAS